LGEEPLDPEETAALLNLANEAAGDLRSAPLAQSASNSGERLDLHFVIRGGHWFVVSPAPLALQTFALDSVLGRSVQEHMPSGAHARAWRILSNEIQMLWHSSTVNDAREQRGARTANALWLHGGGAWAALGPRGVGTLRVDVAPNMGLSAGLNAGPDAGLATASPGPQLIGTAPSSRDAAVLHGWQLAGAGRPEAGAVSPGRTLSVHRELFAPFAHQAWDAWLARVPAWEERLEQELTLAQRQGARHFELVLCGGQESRSYAIALRNPGSPLDAVTGWVRRLPLVGGGALRTSGAGDWARLAESAESDPSTPSGASGGFAPTAQTLHRSGMAR
jgi:hypothetical protein